MGSGYIQLLAVGSEVNIFNYNPNISFFKIYYRRHTNFFINNMEIEGNNVKLFNNDSLNNINPYNKITFTIPKDGDLLGKTYLNLTIDEHYFELFKNNEELISTLNINLLNSYDNYYIIKNNYLINDIKNISIIKINFFYDNNTISNNYDLSIVSTYIINANKLLEYIDIIQNIELQTDVNDIFYNLDLNLLFYSFNIYLNNNSNVINNELFKYLYNNISYDTLSYIQIDFKLTKISIRISYLDKQYYKIILDLLISEVNINLINDIKIDYNNVYLSIDYSLILFNLLIKLFYINSEIFELEIINNKLKSNKSIITSDFLNKITLMILNKNNDTTIYLSILNGGIQSYTILTIMEKISFFGNLTNEYYNDLLIKNGNTVLNIINLNNSKLSLNILTKIYISLVCYNTDYSIENYLKIVNNNKIINSINILKYYSNLNYLNDKLIEFLIDPTILIVNSKSFYVILYSKNIYKYLQNKEYVEQFTNNISSIYTSTINNFYYNSNIIKTTNNNFNDNSNDYYYIISQLLLYDTYLNSSIQQTIINNSLDINYINNNNLFEIIENVTISNINNIRNLKNTFVDINNINNDINTNTIYNILYNNLLLLISQSLILINNIIISNIINYEPNGLLSNNFINTEYSRSIIPLTSYLYMFTNNLKSKCSNKITNNIIYYNINKNNYLINIRDNLINIIYKYLDKIKINISNNILNYSINNFLQNSDFNNIITNYYNEISNFKQGENINYLNNYLNLIKNIDYEIIYPYFPKEQINLNNRVMYQLFIYVDKNLFNNSFSNFSFKKYDKCNTANYNTNLLIELNYEKFIFTINSPLYRIYFYFTFLSKFTIDSILFNINIDNDIIMLRDLLFSFLIYFLNYYDHNIINKLDDNILVSAVKIFLNKFNLNSISSLSYFLPFNFICYDEIKLFENNDFLNNLKNNSSSDYLFLYNNFYIIKKNVDNYQINNLEILNNIPDICNNFKYNYDDKIILLFLNILNKNKDKFINFNNIYNLTLDFFNKNDMNFNKIVSYFTNYTYLSNENNNQIINNNIDENNFYYASYYSTFILGVTFDNNNLNNTNSINNIYSLTTRYNNKYLFDYEYCFKEFVIKQYDNYLDQINNIVNCLQLFQSELFNIFINKNYIDIQSFENYINILVAYTNNNIIYLFLYLLSEFNFNNSISIINKYIEKFNTINNSNISLTYNKNTINYNKISYNKFNFIVIIYYYIYFIYNCLQIDIKSYNNYLNALDVDFINGININLIVTFDQFIIIKYTLNIYEECINDLIKIFYNTNNESLNLDFSTYYIYLLYNNILSTNIFENNIYLNITKQNIFINILENNKDIELTNNNLNYSSINYSNNSVINTNNKTNYLTKITFINKNFNKLYHNSIINLIDKVNKIMYSVNIDKNNFVKQNYGEENISLLENYINLKNYYYDNSIYKLSYIYIKLYSSYNSIIDDNNNNQYKKRILNYTFYNLKNFFENKDFNYFNTLYYFNNNNKFNLQLISKINKNLKFNNNNNNNINNNINEYLDLEYQIEDFINSIDIYTFYSKYNNIQILSSLIYENNLNRIIYYLCTNYLINNSFDKKNIKEIIYKNTLYDIVKLYILKDDDLKSQKTYLNDTLIYSNQSIFQILNYEFMNNTISFTQNYWINYIISNINTEFNLINSYYYLFNKFINYIIFYELEIKLLILDNGESVISYFSNINNYNELTNYIYDYICLNDSYSPNLIFINIIDLFKTNYINTKLNIDTDHLKKKIIIFLFFTWIILTSIPSLLTDFFDINKNIVLEYNIEQNLKIDIKLLDVLKSENNMEIINWSIYQIYNMDLTEDNKNMIISNYPDYIQNNNDILFLVNNAKKISSPINIFNILCDKYINIYFDVIGNTNINTNNLLINSPFKPTLTNIVSDINIIFNNDINSNNPNKYDLTFYSLNLLNIKFNSLIYDLDNTNNNKIINSSEFTEKSKIIYSKTVINDFNLLYNLPCLLLNNYKINYSNLDNDFNEILNYLRKGTNTLNELLEIFKGYVSNYNISNNLTSIVNLHKYNYFTSKIFNIQKLNYIVKNLNNLSIITPNDYDNIPILINYKYNYNKFYDKYYSYNYNYNNFKNNYNVIYRKLYTYYTNITKNTNAIKNIKNYNMNLYIWLFIDLINSYISNIYYNFTTQLPNNYIDSINIIINIYFTYNYSFRINKNINNIENLIIQKYYSKIPYLNNYNEINNYLIGYYYYQLFSTNINKDIVSEFKQDVILFFNTLQLKSNVNYIYIRNFLNIVFKFEIIIRFIIYKINKFYNLNIEFNTDISNKINNILINYLTNIDNIINFFNLKYIKKSNLTSYYNDLFISINNLLDKNLFYIKFINSLSKLIYWINNQSYDINVINDWTENFANIFFEYHVFVDNEYIIKKFTIDIFSFYYLIHDYIYFIIFENTNFINITNNEFIKIYELIFTYKDNNNKLLLINPDIIDNIMLFEFDTSFLKNNTDNKINLFISDINDNINKKQSGVILNIFNNILNIYWGIINYNIILNTPKLNLRACITFYNLYYSYLNYLLNQSKLNIKSYDFNYYSNIYDELFILYNLIINIYTIQYIDNNIYNSLQQLCLTKTYEYIKYGIKINTLDINVNFAIYMDSLNSNIISNNTINNYYKTIQNNTIYDSIKYKLNTFTYSTNNYSDYIIQIFNNQINKLSLKDENTLGSNTFYNIIINSLNNLSANVVLYINNNEKIYNNVIDTIYNNISLQFSLLTYNFGGKNNSSININNSSIKKLFNPNNYKEDNSQITILSLINNQVINGFIYNNIPIILFYYNCFITWSILGINISNDLNYIKNIFYDLSNYINEQILLFTNNLYDKNNNSFFKNLDILLFNNYNNSEFIKATGIFFNEIISNKLLYLPTDTINNLLNINNITLNTSNEIKYNLLNINNINENISFLNIKNSKIINWKYLIGLLADINDSNLIKNIKSIDNVFSDLKIQKNLIDYIIKMNDGLINEYGIIKLINKIELLFDDEIISQYNQYNYKIFIDNFQNINKQELLNKMLNLKEPNSDDNIISGLKPYIKFSYKQNYIIPIKFFFENYSNSIPLIACMNTNIKILTYLNNISIYKNSYNINNLTKLNVKSKLNCDFILVERDERLKLCSKKIDNLIEKNNYYELNKNINYILIIKTDIININFEFELDNLVKEIIWSFKITIDNYELTIIKDMVFNKDFLNNTNNITLDDLVNSSYDFIVNTKFYLDGLRRDGINFINLNQNTSYNKLTTLLNPYKYNTKVKTDKNYNTYSFALEPTEFQPSGAINMSNYKIFRIQVQIDRNKFLKYFYNINTLFNLNDINFKMFLTTYEYNIVRYQSSLAGLLFIS
jgi:hypothetical protein